STDATLPQVLPNVIDDAEQRMYRELDLLNTVTRDSSSSFTAGSRTFNLPTSTVQFLVTQQMNAITPAGQTNPDAGTRSPLTQATKEMIDALWPSTTGSAVPVYYAPISQGQFIVGPCPDQAYTVEVVGTYRPAPLSATNTATLLTNYFPDAFVAASMIFMAGYMKNYGAAVDDPQQGVSWETHYKNLMSSAQTEEQRKKFSSEAWSDKTPAAAGMPRV